MTKKKILIVDDEVEITNILSFLLRREGYDVRTATNGVEAFDLLSNLTFSGVVCDLAMPEMDGLTLLKKVRELSDLVPFIYLSGHARPIDEHEMISFGALEVIQKPNIHLVMPALKKLISTAHDMSSLKGSTKEADEFLSILHSCGKKLA